MDRKQSQFTQVDALSSSDFIPAFGQSTNKKISKADFFKQIKDETQIFIYPTIGQLQTANLVADPDWPIYVRVEETEYRLYKITSLAAGGDDIPLNNGATATFQDEYYVQVEANAATEQEILDGLTNEKIVTPLGASQTILRTFDTPAQAALASLPVGAKYSTKGALAVGDGGAGDFIVEAASGTPDGYSRILLANGNHGVLQPVNGSLDIAQFGEFSALSDEKDKFDAVITACAERQAALVASGSMTILTSGGHVLPAGFELHCTDLTIKRVMSGYTGQEPICEFLDDVTVVGHLTFDGNNPLEAGGIEDSFASLLISGDNVALRGKLSLINTPMYDEAAKQLRGCVVTGDNFYCQEVYGNLCGYGTMNLLITGQMKSFVVDKYLSENHHYKGFSVNSVDTVSLIETIRFDSFKAQTGNEFSHDASAGFQIDTKENNNLIQVLSCEIGTLDVVGGRAGAIKVENTLNFYADNMLLDVTTDLIVGYAMTMHAVNFRCPSLTFNNTQIRIRSNYCWVGSINCEHTNASPIIPSAGIIWLEALADTSTQLTGDKDHNIGRITTKRELSTPSLIRINIEQDINYKCRVDYPDTHSVEHVFTNFNGIDKVRGGNLSVGYVDDMAKLNASNNIQKWVAIGSGLYTSRSGAPSIGTYKKGDYVKNLDSVPIGTAPTGYIVKGWICTTGGSEGTFVFAPDRVPLV